MKKVLKFLIIILTFFLAYDNVLADAHPESCSVSGFFVDEEDPYPDEMYAKNFPVYGTNTAGYGGVISGGILRFPFSIDEWSSDGTNGTIHYTTLRKDSLSVTTHETYCLSPYLYNYFSNKGGNYVCKRIYKNETDSTKKKLVSLLMEHEKPSDLDQNILTIATRMIAGLLTNCGPESTITRGTGNTYNSLNPSDNNLHKACTEAMNNLIKYYKNKGSVSGTTISGVKSTKFFSQIGLFNESGLKTAYDWASTASEHVDENWNKYVNPDNIDKYGSFYYCEPNSPTNDMQTFFVKIELKKKKKKFEECPVDPDSPTGEEIDKGEEDSLHNCCLDNAATSVANAASLDAIFSCDCYRGLEYFRLKMSDTSNGSYYYGDIGYDNGYEAGNLYHPICKLYCIDKVKIHNVDQTNIYAGHYFMLNRKDITTDSGITIKETSAPVAEDNRECRIRIRYDVWLDSIYEAVKAEISAYNDYQKDKSLHEIYVDKTLSENQKGTMEVSCYYSTTSRCKKNSTCNPLTEAGCSCLASKKVNGKCPITVDDDSKSYSFSSTISNTQHTDYDYNKYVYSPSSHTYYTVKLKEENYDIIFNNNQKAKKLISVQSDSSATHTVSNHVEIAGGGTIEDRAKSYYNLSSIAENHKKTIKCEVGDDITITPTCSVSYGDVLADKTLHWNTTSYGKRYSETVAELKEAADIDKGNVIDAAKQADTLKHQLDDCHTFFSAGKGTDPEIIMNSANHSFSPNLTVKYNQYYLDDYGEVISSFIDKEYERVDNGSKVGNVNYNPKYSGLYGDFNNKSEIADFSVSKLEGMKAADTSSDKFKSYIVTDSYIGDPVFTIDGSYYKVYSWKDNDGLVCTLAPYGMTTVSSVEKWVTAYRMVNMIKHKYVLYLKQTVMEGKYNVYYNFTGLDHTGVIDEKLSTTTMCNGKTINDDENFANHSCVLNVKSDNTVVTAGGCPPIYIDPPINTCKTDVGQKYQFKIVDPKVLFANCSSLKSENAKAECFENLKYGYNWLIEDAINNSEKGIDYDVINGKKSVLDEMMKTETFSPNNITYSFTLNSEDLKQIRNYNEKEGVIAAGGYEDSDLVCECNDQYDYELISTAPNAIDGLTYKLVLFDDSCRKCKSQFVSDLAENRINNEQMSHDIWSNSNKNISQVRDSNWW